MLMCRMCALPSSCGLGYICVPPPSQALHRGVFVALPSRERVSSLWQLPKVLSTLLRVHGSFGAFVLLLTSTYALFRGSAYIFDPAISNPLTSSSLGHHHGAVELNRCLAQWNVSAWKSSKFSDDTWHQMWPTDPRNLCL